MSSEERADLVGSVLLPSLRFCVHVAVRGVPEEMVPLIAARWDFSGAHEAPDAELELEVTDEPVGLAPNPLVEAEVGWSSPCAGTLLTNAASVSLSWEGPLRARGSLQAAHARGALESLFRAVSVLALARRGVTVVHASCVHRGGKGIMFLGASSAGKTTTARRLGREGFSRLADDMVAVEFSARGPRLHPLPFERAGRWPAGALALGEPPLCVGAAVVRKGAELSRLVPVEETLSIWAEARIALGAPPGDEQRTLDTFEALTRIPLAAFEVPPRGRIGAVIAAWFSGNESERAGRQC